MYIATHILGMDLQLIDIIVFLMLTKNRMPGYLLIIPSLWALIGTAAATNFGVYQDNVMLVAAILANIFLLSAEKKG